MYVYHTKDYTHSGIVAIYVTGFAKKGLIHAIINI